MVIHLQLEGRNDKVNGPGSFLKRWEGFKVDTVFVAASGDTRCFVCAGSELRRLM